MELEKPSAVSIRDKVDYRKEIHKIIDMCLMTFDNPSMFKPNVKKLVACVCNDYPGIDLKTPIETEMNILLEEYNATIREAKKDGEIWYHPLKRSMLQYDTENTYWYKLFDCIMNMLGSKRVLMWGKKTPMGGTPSKDIDSTPFNEEYDVEG